MVDRSDNAPMRLLRELGTMTASTVQLSRGFGPLLKLVSTEDDVTRDELRAAIDQAFEGIYRHPLLLRSERLTRFLRARRLIPNEQSTEELIRFLVEQLVARSPMPVPQQLVDEFWNFFNELFSSPELKGLGELSLDMSRLVIATYEPMLVEVINILKAGRRFNQWQWQEISRRVDMIRQDAVIVRRQIRALRHIKPFFQADPKDYQAQAQIVARMVSEFGPFFVKMAQAAAANADFLPEEIARELAVFHDDVAPMNEEEVNQAFLECFGALPQTRYLDFDPARPVRSGSIGSVYYAKKPFLEDGREVLRPVVVKVGRQNIDREFAIGKLVLGLAIMSSQYWAPHTKLAPFLRAMQEQVDEFVAGFMEELDFESEARHQLRFYRRSLSSRMWRVPELYASSRRVIEMEYLSDAASLTRALSRVPRAERRRFQRQVSERLLYTLLYHVFVHRELHGDLHPGNVMIGRQGTLYLIDWGNVVALDGKWELIWNYLAGAIVADSDVLADALIRMSTAPDADAQRRAEVRALLQDTLDKRGITRLTRFGFAAELGRGGLSGLHRRGQAVLHLMSNTQQAGLVLRRDYLHLSRALFAACGSIGSLYDQDPRLILAADLARGVARMPMTVAHDRAHHQWRHLRERVAAKLRLGATVANTPRVDNKLEF